MTIQEITSREEWDSFVLHFPGKTFLHSWQWGEVHVKEGGTIFRRALFDEERLIGVALILKITARRGTFLFCPHGPLLTDWKQFGYFADHLKLLAKREHADFIRISPFVSDVDISTFRHVGFRPAPIHMHAETTWTLDLTPTEETLLSGMKKTMRNLVRRGTKEGIQVQFGVDQKMIDEFYELHKQTVQLQDFVPFSKAYIENEISVFSPDNIMVALAYHEGNALAGAVVPIYDRVGYYHHGASVHSKIPAAYTLQWEIIRELKRRSCSLYNFWGIAPTQNPKHPWHGLSQFKMGFGGYRTDYLHAQDYPLTWKYWVNYAVETMRRIQRGF